MSHRKKLGVPDHDRRSPALGEAPAIEQAPAPKRRRTLGVPAPVSCAGTEVPDEKKLFDRAEETIMDPAEPLAFDPSGPRWSPLRYGSVAALLVMGIGLMLLFLTSQLALTMSVLNTLPAPARWIGWTAVAAISLAVLVATGYLIWRYVKLRQSPNVSLEALAELHDRARTRAAAREQTTSALRLLKRFLDEYPLDEKNRRHLEQLGFTGEELAQLISQHEWLTAGAKGSDTMWLRDVDQRFLGVLDEVAQRRIWRHARHVGMKTAVAPTGFVDSCIALISMYTLVGDLCAIYNVRANSWSTALILVRSFINGLAAGQMEKLTGDLGDQISEYLNDSLGAAVSKVAGWTTSRGAEGAANAMLLLRLGNATLRALRPIAAA